MPTIRIDDEVWAWLKHHARPLEDTPNSVLRRIAQLGDESGLPGDAEAERMRKPTGGAIPRSVRVGRHRASPRRVFSGLTGRQLNVEWNVNAKQALYHKKGIWYNHLSYFPGALFDPNGYVVFKSEEQYRRNPHLRHGKQLDVPGGIASMPGYVRVPKPA